jgi:phage-related tail fiber protein
MNRLRHATVATLVAFFAGGCSSQIHVAGGGAGPVLGAPIHMAAGDVRASFNVVGDATQILKEAAGDSFAAAKMTCSGGGACASVDLRAQLASPSPSFSRASPPLRVVELIATYRAAGAASTSTVSYQRTVAVPGNMSTATWMRISDALTTDLASDFRFRSKSGGIVVRLPSWATMQTSLPAASQPLPFHVATTGDGRENDVTIGTVGKREVRLARNATDYITEMLTDDLRGTGHTIVPAKDGRLVGSELEKFWIASTQGSGGWNTTAEIEVDFEVGPPPGVKRKKPERHSCRVTERTGHAPSEPELARILQRCLVDLVRSIRNDSAWSMKPA